MPHVTLGPTPAGRYPRWGYLDRLETNPHLPRAGAAVLALASLAVLAVLVTRHSFAGSAPNPALRRVEMPGATRSSSPLPPPSIVPRAGGPRRAAATKFQLSKPVPVDDPHVAPETLSNPSGGQGAGDGDVGNPGSGNGEGRDIGVVTEPLLPPSPEVFIACEQRPELVSMDAPVYPELARAAGIEGTVLVRVLVGADGFVKESTLLQGVLGLDEAALAAAGTAVFRPGRQQGRPLAVWIVIPIEFRLRS